MNLGMHKLKTARSPLYGFIEDSIKLLGIIQLMMMVRDQPTLINFLVVDCLMPYNVVIGHSA